MANHLNLFKKISENKAPEYLINKLAKFKSEINYNFNKKYVGLPSVKAKDKFSLRRSFFTIFEKVDGFRNKNKPQLMEF